MPLDNLITLCFALAGILLGGIVGPALSWFTEGAGKGRSLQEISFAAKSGTYLRRARQAVSRNSATNDDLFAWLVGAVIIIFLYVRWRPWVLVILAGIGISIGLAATVVVVIAWLRRVIAGTHAIATCLILPFIYGAAGIVVAALLWRTPFAPDGVRHALAVCDFNASGNGTNGLQYLVYTIFGGALYVILALSTVRWQMAAVAAIYAAEDVRPARFWHFAACRLSLPLGWGWAVSGMALTVLTILFAGGWPYTWINQLQG